MRVHPDSHQAERCAGAKADMLMSALFQVTMAAGNHLFPSRTEKLSPPAPMVLQGRPCGRVGRRLVLFTEAPLVGAFVVFDGQGARGQTRARHVSGTCLAPFIRINTQSLRSYLTHTLLL